MNHYQLSSTFIWRIFQILRIHFHLEETSIFYGLLISKFIQIQINLISDWKIRSNQEVLWRRAFLDNSGEFSEKKTMAESVFSKASRKITLWMFSGQFSENFQNSYSTGKLIQDGYLWSKYIFMSTEKIWYNMGCNFRLTWVFEQCI